jgi:uncharacterized repeat protein (TIGR02543 family)
MRRAIVLLIMVALVAGTAACRQPQQYSLTIASTSGGCVTSPGEGTFTYREGRVVRLVARSCLGYQFAGWAGDVATISTAKAFVTTITMNGDYSITANFGCACGR